MTAWQRVRQWLVARRRFEFVLILSVVIGLTAAGGALVLLPKAAVSRVNPMPASSTEATLDPDPQIAELRRVMESYGPVVTRHVEGADGRLSTVLGHPGQRDDIETLAREVGPAVTNVTGLWGRDWSQRAVVTIASGTAEFAALTHATGTVSSGVAAASVSDPFVPGNRPTGQRVVFSEQAGRRLGADGMRETLRHELTHVAARAQTIDGSPQWVLEGFAEYSARRADHAPFARDAPVLTARARSGDLPADLPGDPAFVPTTGNDAELAYEQAWSANAYVADRFGEPKLVELYRRMATGPKDAHALDDALGTCLGVRHGDFVTDWQDWIRSRIAS